MKRMRSWITAALVAGGAAGASAPARAASTPTQATVTIKCGIVQQLGRHSRVPECKALGKGKDGWINGRLDWYSNGVLLFSEDGPFYTDQHDERGEVHVFVDGNGDQATFDRFYVAPATTILAMPWLTFKLWVDRDGAGHNDRPVLAAEQPYLPLGSVLWALHSEDAAAAEQAALTAQQAAQAAQGQGAAALAAAQAASQQAQAALQSGQQAQAAVAQLSADLAVERAARIAGDGAVGVALQAEMQASLAADAGLTSALGAATQARIAGDAATVTAAGQHANGAAAAEAAARAAADAALQASIDGEAVARQQGDATTLAAANTYSDAQVAAVAAARQAAEAALGAALGTETAERQQGDAAALVAANAHTDAQVAVERAARVQGDGALQAAIDAEAVARQQGDAAAVATANGYTDAAVHGVHIARQAADAAISASLDSEIAARKQGDLDTLAAAGAYTDARVAAEAGARQAGDTALQTALANEIAARQQGDAGLVADANGYTDGQVAAESAARQAADVSAQAQIAQEAAVRAQKDNAALATAHQYAGNAVDAEAQARATRDAALQTAINGLISAITVEGQARATGDQALATALASEIAARQQGDAIALSTAGAYTDSRTPMPLSCPNGQTPIATGPGTWACGAGGGGGNGNACPSGQYAMADGNGGVLCRAFCSGQFSDIQTDVNNCGGCGSDCNALPHVVPSCANGQCGIAACIGNWVDCDGQVNNGCEANFAADPNNCGGCGNVCPQNAPFCVNSACGQSTHGISQLNWDYGGGNNGCGDYSHWYTQEIGYMDYDSCEQLANQYGAQFMGAPDFTWYNMNTGYDMTQRWVGEHDANTAWVTRPFADWSNVELHNKNEQIDCVLAYANGPQHGGNMFNNPVFSSNGKQYMVQDFGIMHEGDCYSIARDNAARPLNPAMFGMANGQPTHMSENHPCHGSVQYTGDGSWYQADGSSDHMYRCFLGYNP